MRFLLIDDDQEDIDLIKEIFEDSEQEVQIESFSNGLNALKHLADIVASDGKLPEVILLDVKMPGISGNELLEKIKSHNTLNAIPVIIFSTSVSNEDILELYSKGASCYINKPKNRSEYKEVVNIIISFWTQSVYLPGR